MLDTLNVDGLNIRKHKSNPLAQYIWADTTGGVTSLSDPSRYIILREGIEGFSNSTAEYSTEQTANLMSEVLTQTNVKKREFGFNILILGEKHADLEAKRKELLRVLSHKNRTSILTKTFDNGSSVSIKCNISPGYPRIPDGLPPKHQAKSQVVEVRFIAADPYFYGSELSYEGDSNGNVSVFNPGDSEAPCEIRIKSQTCTNLTSGKAMRNRSGRLISGLTVSVDDRRIRAVDEGGVNALANFTHDSQFWMIEPGWNQLQGVESVTFTPRWSGI